MATAVDIPHLSAYLAFPETSLSTALTDPTPELIASLLNQIAAKAHEHEAVQSEKYRLEVELESAVHSADSKTRGLKVSVDRGLKEAADLRQKLQAEGELRR